DLGAGEVAGEREPGLPAEAVLTHVAAQFAAERVGAGVLPDDGVVHRLTGRPVPQQGGLALVGDANGAEGVGAYPGPGERIVHDGPHPGPDLGGVVLDPPRSGEDLLVLLLVDRGDAAVAV